MEVMSQGEGEEVETESSSERTEVRGAGHKRVVNGKNNGKQPTRFGWGVRVSSTGRT
jgi:hypothetical protein